MHLEEKKKEREITFKNLINDYVNSLMVSLAPMKKESSFNFISRNSFEVKYMDILDLERMYVTKHVWDQLFTVDTIWNIGETGDINLYKNQSIHVWKTFECF